jgi:hypothetical protein
MRENRARIKVKFSLQKLIKMAEALRNAIASTNTLVKFLASVRDRSQL